MRETHPSLHLGVQPLFDRTGRLFPKLQQALERGAVILTGNLRAARALQFAYAADQQSRGATAWPTPRILDWSSWVSQLWEQYARRAQADAAPMPLTSLQEHQLWKQVQGKDRERVVAPDRLAELAQQAYTLLSDYCAHPLRVSAAAAPFGEAHEDAERFLAWASDFDRLCRHHGWLSQTRLVERLTEGVPLLDAPCELVLVGFDRITPAQSALLRALTVAGTLVTPHAESQSVAAPMLVQAKSQREELEACAWWCREQLARPVHADGTKRIGVILPDLGRVRAELDRVFRRILMPQTTLWANAPAADPPMPYEFSLGTPLAGLPLIRSAMLLLRWLAAPLASAELTWLLTSGFLAGSPADQQALARLDAELRTVPEISIAWLLKRGRSRNLPDRLRARLERLRGRALSAETRRHTYAHWAELLPVLLDEAGWPGHRELDSFAYQAQQRWTRLLGELAQLGFDGSQPSWSEFLLTLERHARTVIFAAESTTPPIQILGAFESSGQSFDALWFLGADDQHWPAAGRLHPLLPAWLQREAGMPHAAPDADWLLAQQATARIVSSAPRVVLSYPAQEQAVSLRASPLLLAHAGKPAVNAADLVRSLFSNTTPTDRTPAEMQSLPLEAVADDSGVLPWPAEQSAGGAEILKRQAACAFQSFAMRRLRATPLEEAEHGLNARERGTLLHQVLQSLWSIDANDPMRLHSHEDLIRAGQSGSVTEIVANAIQSALAPHQAEAADDPWQIAYLETERERVRSLLLAWLDEERRRQPFTVTSLEENFPEIQVGALRLKVRPDRVDLLADGTRLLIDYKTGKVKTNAWDGDRPEEPQLPLYAVFGGVKQVSGVAFAQIRADETKLLVRAEDPAGQVSAGLSAAKHRFDDDVRDQWRETLLGLGNAFVRGQAEVNPRDELKTCKYCPLPGLCRVHERGDLFEEEDEGLE